MLFLLKCPKCKHNMKYDSQGASQILAQKSKKCVYCGRSFIARNNIVKAF